MKYQVADYVIDTATYRITTGGDAIPVEPRVFDLLVYLIRHRDRVLSREELFQEVWDGREVSDATLSNHVKSVRKILGDSGELQQTILTIRGRGYQFIAPVREIVDDAATRKAATAPPPPETAPVSKPVATTRRVQFAMAVVVLFAGALFGWRHLAPSHAPPDSAAPYVVVVPFDVSADVPDTWRPFADQVTREVIRNLQKISGLEVVPTPSAFAFRENKTHEHVRRQLPDVRYVLDGVV
ncbi:MAG TPA: winged helix-turn-helix domain-containing protein, partial [Povalibacter sp.]|nr:winged helix-turn-helix domain-containing protein [Povalibacter sp.]